jgi:tol-pal system protein YbgF
MKTRLLMLLCACITTANAEPRSLPPVVDYSTYPAGTANPGAIPANAVYELMGRLDRLQTEVQQLTGKVEEQAHQIAELKKSQNTMYSDFDERLHSIESNTTGNAPADIEAPLEQESAVDPAANTAEPAAPAVSAPAPAVQQPAAAPQASDTEKQQYQQAYEALRRGHTNQSITEFNSFISQYPNGTYASNAQYWLGEAYKVNQDIEAARKAFNAVIQNYPSSPKVPDALLKLGYIEFDQKNWPKARDYLTRITGDYPSSTAAYLAKKKLLQIEVAKP